MRKTTIFALLFNILFGGGLTPWLTGGFALFLGGGLTPCFAQDSPRQDSPRQDSLAQGMRRQGRRCLRIAALTCENLFDTIDCPTTRDEEFLPQGERHWTSQRYWRKLNMIAREIVAISTEQPVDLVALVEVESDAVMRDLSRGTGLRALGYEYILGGTDDGRGVRVALLYHPGAFRPLQSSSVSWGERLGTVLPTRHMLHVEGLARSGDTLYIMVCHMPSKAGKLSSKKYRRAILTDLRSYCDSIAASAPPQTRANIIIIGDMNDTPDSRDMRTILTGPDSDLRRVEHRPAKWQRSADGGRIAGNGVEASYRYKGNWEMLDQCIVSSHLLSPTEPLHVSARGLQVVGLRFLLEQDITYGGLKPWRTWQGPLYRGGFSDHLPIVVELEF